MHISKRPTAMQESSISKSVYLHHDLFPCQHEQRASTPKERPTHSLSFLAIGIFISSNVLGPCPAGLLAALWEELGGGGVPGIGANAGGAGGARGVFAPLYCPGPGVLGMVSRCLSGTMGRWLGLGARPENVCACGRLDVLGELRPGAPPSKLGAVDEDRGSGF